MAGDPLTRAMHGLLTRLSIPEDEFPDYSTHIKQVLLVVFSFICLGLVLALWQPYGFRLC